MVLAVNQEKFLVSVDTGFTSLRPRESLPGAIGAHNPLQFKMIKEAPEKREVA